MRLNYKTAAFDTMVFIYYFEENASYVAKIEKLFKAVEDKKVKAFTTIISLSEILVRPLSLGNADLADNYKNAINTFPNLTVLPVNQSMAVLAASLKAKYRIKLPDAIQVAGALFSSSEVFITNDKDLKKIKEIKVVTLSDL